MLAIEKENLTKSFSITSSSSAKRRKLNPTSGSLNYRTKVRRRIETVAACNAIYGSS